MSQAILHVTIRGRVQGVGYRAWLEHRAGQADLEGWVRNRADGSVEAVFAGPARLTAEMVALCRHGPPSARVEAVLRRVGRGGAARVAPGRRAVLGASNRVRASMATLVDYRWPWSKVWDGNSPKASR